jgi:hypothetical protein
MSSKTPQGMKLLLGLMLVWTLNSYVECRADQDILHTKSNFKQHEKASCIENAKKDIQEDAQRCQEKYMIKKQAQVDSINSGALNLGTCKLEDERNDCIVDVYQKMLESSEKCSSMPFEI